MTSVTLREITSELESGSRPRGGVDASGDIPSVGGEHLDDGGAFKFENIKRIPESFYSSMKSGKIAPRDILIVKDGATTGKTSFVRADFPFSKAAVNEHVFRLAVNWDAAVPEYVFRFLSSPGGQKLIMSDFRGATVGGIGRTFLDRVVIPLPPLDEQRRIAAILDQADALHRKRAHAFGLLQHAKESFFRSAFGDPIKNSNAYPVTEIGTLGKVSTGKTPSTAERENFGDEVEFVTPRDLESGQPVARKISAIGASKIKVVRPGATLVCCIGATIGKMGMATRNCAFNQQLNAIEWNEHILDDYGFAAMRYLKKEIVSLGASTTLPILKKSSFEKLKIPVPPIKEQEAFVTRVRRLDQVNYAMRSAYLASKNLFDAIQAKLFGNFNYANLNREIVE